MMSLAKDLSKDLSLDLAVTEVLGGVIWVSPSQMFSLCF